MDEIIGAIRNYTQGLLTRDEMDEILSRSQVHGAVEGMDFTGYDYGNQAWIQIRLS